MSTVSSSLRFVNVRWTVSATVRLSISHWGTKDGGVTHAVALLRKCGRKWVVDGETAAEFSGKDADYRSTDYGAKLVAVELGECPLRFFRDNAL